VPLKEIPFGEMAPDNAQNHTNSVYLAKNVRAMPNGYGPVGSFETVATTLGAAFVGGGSFIGSDGNSTLLAATAAKLRKYSGSWADVSTIATTSRWYFAQFGDNVVYANGDQLGAYDLLAATAGDLTDAPDNAIDVATVRDFVMVLTDDSQVVWSGFNDCTSWTPGTDQSDAQPLLDGGTGVRIIGGEYAIVLQKNCIRRVSYNGVPDVWFQLDVINPEVGCMAAGSVCNVGRLIGFLSERGFELCDGENVIPIGDTKVNEWFFSTYSRADIADIWAAADPRRNEFIWLMPGNPGRALVFNLTLKRWTLIETALTGVLTGQTSSVSIDAVDALYPGGIDSIPISLDDPSLQGGNPLLLFVDDTYAFGGLSGEALEAQWQQKNVELTPGRRSRLRAIRPVTDATSAAVTVSQKMRAGDGVDEVVAASMRLNGKMPIRANGRYLDVTTSIPEGEAWTYVQGNEYEFEPGDAR
jgi:hypothetical protein